METEALEDVKQTRLCKCGHTLAFHGAEGGGRCTLCACHGQPPLDEPDAVEESVAADKR
jgi:hypothetical protein